MGPGSPEHENLLIRDIVRRYVHDNPRFLRRDWLATSTGG
jgi:hypothetical protein